MSDTAHIRAAPVFSQLELLTREHEEVVRRRDRWDAEQAAAVMLLLSVRNLESYDQVRVEVVERLDTIHRALFGTSMVLVQDGRETGHLVAGIFWPCPAHPTFLPIPVVR